VQLTRTGAVVLIVTALVILPIAASASPPDPMRTAGICDAADGDDVVTPVTEATVSKHGPTYDLVSPLRSPEEVTPPPGGSYESSRSAQSTRGPPQTFAPRRDESPLDGISTHLFSHHYLASCGPWPGPVFTSSSIPRWLCGRSRLVGNGLDHPGVRT
jgi:hypothetical protein